MIRRLRGQVIDRTASTLVVDVHDVGYLVTVSAQCRHAVGDHVDLHVHTHVREDALQLFGFMDALEREVFDLLIGVPTIGPVKAIGILATSALEIVELITRKDSARLSKLPGVGKKTAERMVVDLYEKVIGLSVRADLAPRPGGSLPRSRSAIVGDLASALINLGFRPSVADEAAESAVERLGEGAGLQPLLKDALMHAGGR